MSDIEKNIFMASRSLKKWVLILLKVNWLAHKGIRAIAPVQFMKIIRDKSVSALISTIGGANSSSMIPYLDFDEIRAHPKVICGYSDVTSLHLSILAYSGLSTFYGPAVMPSLIFLM